MSTPEEPPKRKAPLTGAGIALVVIGLLILVPSGLCTGLIGIGGTIASLYQGSTADIPQILTEAISFGLIPILIGAFLLWAGLRLRQKKWDEDRMSVPENPGTKRSFGVVAWSIALIVVGLLIVVPSGLCTGLLGFTGIKSCFQSGNCSGVFVVFAVGGIPFAVGIAFLWSGINLLRSK